MPTFPPLSSYGGGLKHIYTHNVLKDWSFKYWQLKLCQHHNHVPWHSVYEPPDLYIDVIETQLVLIPYLVCDLALAAASALPVSMLA